MSDLISRQAAIDAIHNLYAIHGSEGSWIDQKDAFKALNSLPSAQPTVDAEPVIRCKDCKYYSYGTVEGKHLCMSVKYRFTPTTEDEWCSRAERKEE